MNISFAAKNTRNVLLDRTNESNSEKYAHVKERLESCTDLLAAKARYHRSCYRNFMHHLNQEGERRNKTVTFLEYVDQHFKKNTKENQFSFNELCINFTAEAPVWSTKLKESMLTFCGNHILFHEYKDDIIITYQNFHQICLEFYAKKQKDPAEVKMQIVEKAGKIILDDIMSEKFETDTYDPPQTFFNNVETVIPKTLRRFLDVVMQKNKKGKLKPHEIKIISIAHAIMHAARPKAFISNVLLGLAATLDRKFGSRELIDILSKMGFCHSYKDTQIFEGSIIVNNLQPNISGYIQMVSDNTDWNTKTEYGHGTFHASGNILCVTPSDAIDTNYRINKIDDMPSDAEFSSHGIISLKTCPQNLDTVIGLNGISAKDVCDLNKINMDIVLRKSEFIWLAAKHIYSFKYTGWNSFMEDLFDGESYVLSRIMPLPFIDAAHLT